MKKKLLVVIIAIVILVIVNIILLCGGGKNENIINYFSKKYDIKKSELKVIKEEHIDGQNGMKDEDRFTIKYNNKEYLVIKREEKLTDNYQAKRLEKEFKKYIENKFPGVRADICPACFENAVLTNNIKYDGNVDKYFSKIDTNSFILHLIYNVKEEQAEELNEKTASNLISYISKYFKTYDIRYMDESKKENDTFYTYNVINGTVNYFDNINGIKKTYSQK